MLAIFLIECLTVCAVFTVINIAYLLKRPMDWFYDYPEEVQARMRTLPMYQGKIPLKKHSDRNKKIPAGLLFTLMLSAIVWFSGAHHFMAAAGYTFMLFMIVNLYDALVLDTFYFCHSKRVRFPGTEDMIKEYRNPKKHWIGFAKGTVLAAFLAPLVGCIVIFIHVVSCLI
ncbi:MAG: hypothetical protein ABF868_03150 [Sporolactobacillus sp.]